MPRTLHRLPEVINPPNDRCILFFVPDDPAYLQAFFGQIGQLARWHNWQRDSAKLGAQVAERFLQSYHESIAFNLGVDFDMCPLTLNITCGTCGNSPLQYEPNTDAGQLPQDVIDDILNIPGGLVDDGINPPTANFPDYATYRSYKCDAATKMADDLLETFNKLGSLGGLFVSLSVAAIIPLVSATPWAMAFVGWLSVYLTPIGALAVVISAIAGVLIAGSASLRIFFQLRQTISRDDLICLFYNAGNPAEARAQVIAELRAQYPSIDWTGSDETLFDTFLLNLMDAVAPDEAFGILFDYVAGYATGGVFNCSECENELVITTEYGTQLTANTWASDDYITSDITGRSRLSIYLGGTLPGQIHTPPYATITHAESDPGLVVGGVAYTWQFQRPAEYGGNIVQTSAQPTGFPIEGVSRILVHNSAGCPADQQPCYASFEAFIVYEETE